MHASIEIVVRCREGLNFGRISPSHMNTPEEEKNLFIHNEIIVDAGQEMMRIDRYLMGRLEKVSRNRLQNAIRAGAILVNKKQIKPNYKVKPNDFIQVFMAHDPFREMDVLPENIPLKVIYEDDALMIINKPAGMVVHPGISNPNGTLVNALTYYFQNLDLPLLPNNPRDRPGIVHRIDKDTTGLMIIAKTDYAMTHLARQFFNHTVMRKYHAIVWGNFDEVEGSIEGHIGRSMRDRAKMDVYEDGEYGKAAKTHFRVLKDFYYVSLVECQLETGRTHQIRVHMKHVGHPVFGDGKYGGDQIMKGTVYTKYKQFVTNCLALCNRHCLHAKTIGFDHPDTGERMTFDSTLPDDMLNVIRKWEGYFEQKRSNL